MKIIINTFWNPAENRLRAGWRLILQLLLAGILLILLATGAAALLALFSPPGLSLKPGGGSAPLELAMALASGLAIAGSVLLSPPGSWTGGP